MSSASQSGGFSVLDWGLIAAYFALIVGFGAYLARRGSGSASDFFLADRGMPTSLICFSVLATTQSAATFLGGPDIGYSGNYAYLSSFIGAVIASLIVAAFLLPRFYALGVSTVYEMLAFYYGTAAMRVAAGFYLVGRVLANGARLYLAALAVAIILYSQVDFNGVAVAAIGISLVALLFTISGGLRSVVVSDALQFAVYTGVALAILVYLYVTIDMAPGDIVAVLKSSPDGTDKTAIFNLNWRLDDPFSLPAILTGLVLLNTGNFGMDQDTTQRLLAARSSRQAGLALVGASLIAVPLVFMFVSIGQLLFVLHQTRGGDMEGVRSATVFMEFIVNELPAGFRGLAMTGVLAAAVSTLNSSYNSMASVVVSDFYTPLVPGRSDRHYVAAGRLATVVLALILLVTALVCYQWQSASGVPLLAFALQMMVYAYAGLIGVFAVAVMTRRGSAASIIAAMFTGFAVTLALDPTIADMIGLTGPVANLAFPWSLTLGSICAFLAGLTGNRRLNRARPGPVGTG